MQITVNPNNPDDRQIASVVSLIRNGGVVIMPTDTIYALVCDIYNPKAIDRICRIKNVRLERSNLSFLCSSLTNISKFTRPFDRNTYKLLNRALPGPYTFILAAGSEVPSIFRSKKKTIGIRIPDNKIVQAVVEEVGNPLMSTSLHNDDSITEYPTDPYDIYTTFGKDVDCVVDGGSGHHVGSTVIDCTGAQPEVIRVGAGDISILE